MGQVVWCQRIAVGGLKHGSADICWLLGEMDEPVDPGVVGPQVGAKQSVGAAVGEQVGDFGVRPVGNAVPGVVGALADAGSGVERDVQGRAYKLGVMVDADSGGELLVIGGREKRQGLAESFEQHLLGWVHGKEPDPGNGPGGAALRVTGSLEAVAEDFVQGELPGLDLGEAGLPQVQAQADVPAAAVGPVGPVGVDRGGVDAQGIGRRGPGELPDLRLVFARGVPDGIGGVLRVDRQFYALELVAGLGVPADTNVAKVLAGDGADVLNI